MSPLQPWQRSVAFVGIGLLPLCEGRAAEPAEPLPPIFASSPPAKEDHSPRTVTPPRPTPSSRAVSPAMAAKLSAVAGRVISSQGIPAAFGNSSSAAESDSSTAVQLDPYIVLESRLPRLKERDLLTAKGKLALARHRYPGLGPLTDAAALSRLAEDFAEERRQEAIDLKDLLELEGPKVPPALKRKLDEATRLPSSLGPRFGESYRLPK